MAMALSTPSGVSDMPGVGGNMRYVFKTAAITGDSTGGNSLVPGDVGLEAIYMVLADAVSQGYMANYDYTNQTVDVWEAAANGAAFDQGASGSPTVNVRLIIFGR